MWNGIEFEITGYKAGSPGHFNPYDGGHPPESAEVEWSMSDPDPKDYPEFAAWLSERCGDEITEAAIEACENAAVDYAERCEERDR
jgi:hypothetical protein